MGEFILRVSRKNECWSRLDVGGRKNHDKVYTGSSLVQPKEARASGQEREALIVLGSDEI